MQELWELTREAIAIVTDALSIEFPSNGESNEDNDDSYFKVLELGGVVHELGTIPMAGGNNDGFCVESDLKLREHEGVYVCDLSVFPYCPEVNPTLTLAALAFRLSRTELLPGPSCIHHHRS